MPRYPLATAKAEEVIKLPTPSKGQLNKIVKQRSTGWGGLSKVYVCLQNSSESYEWVQIATST